MMNAKSLALKVNNSYTSIKNIMYIKIHNNHAS